ncbi:MAG: mannose-1-phosphate guanylyltransferase, partial [Phaeodactylibacter sp.]|nr:mannose-1-phosphate guanylyltransferase [Phaeodactylibacter sp.]
MNPSNVYVAIMAGGVGSRFWPASRAAKPKQFLDILGVGKSLLRLTFERFLKLCPASHIYIVTNKQYAALVREQLPELSEGQVITEPSRNNTAPCVAYTAFKLEALNPEANLVVAPSDHIILQEEAFIHNLQAGLDFTSRHDALLTLGIQPTRPDTGYGYINYEKGYASTLDGGAVHKVFSFTEKPPMEKAREYLASGDYLWNAGIFVWRVESVLKAFREYAGDIYSILAAGQEHYNTPAEQAFIDEAYPTTPSISVDYAIMEKAPNVYTIPSSFGWSDLGTWASLHAESLPDDHGNTVQGSNVKLYDTYNCMVRAPHGKLLVLGGLDDFIIVDEGDALLIWPKNREQEIKQVTGDIR